MNWLLDALAPPTRFVVALAILLLAMLALSTQAQSTGDQQNSDEATAEDMADSSGLPALEADDALIEVESIVALAFGSYDTGWMRFFNGVTFAAPILHAEGISQFPFRAASIEHVLELVDLADPQLILDLIADNALTYSEDDILGLCDVERLAKYGTTDILCEPGASILPHGYAFLTLYNPESLEIVALTETIYNWENIATRADEWRDAAPLPEAEPEEQPDISTEGAGCGPWNGGRWISAAEYRAAGIPLPIVEAQVIDAPTHYQCMIPASGSPYLEAYTVRSSADPGRAASDDSGSGGSETGARCPLNEQPFFDKEGNFILCGTDF